MDKYDIDVKEYDRNWDEQLIKSRITPGDDYTREVNFTQSFFFKRSDYDERLKATANGMTSNVFQGCRYQAKEGRLLSVDVFNGNQSDNFHSGYTADIKIFINYVICFLMFFSNIT